MDDMRARWPRATYRESEPRAEKIARQIFDTAGGNLPLHLLGTPWQIKVWQALLEIPSGKVTTYRNIAEKVHSKPAARSAPRSGAIRSHG